MHRRHFTVALGLALCLVSLSPQDAAAAAKKALFVGISGPYNADGVNMYNELNAYATAYHNNTPGLVDYVLLDVDGEVAALLSQNTYEQIWVYDLSYYSDVYPNDYVAIDAWYDAAPLKEVICDGRFLSSFWNSRYSGEGRLLTANYYKNLEVRGGGIVLATDHDEYANLGMNDLANTLGFDDFTGNFGGPFPLDAGHPLTTDPHVLTSLENDSTTGQAPFGVQPGGRILRTIGYHSGSALNPGISTTIDGGVLGITVTIGQAGGALCSGTRTFTASITQGSEFGPFTYQWRIDNAVVGTGPSYTFDSDTVLAGDHEVRVIAQGAGARADDESVTVTVGGATCGCGFDAAGLCGGDGAVFAIALEGPLPYQYAVCRLVPEGLGTPAAFTDEFRCTDDNNDGVVDLIDGALLATQFGAGFCGYPSEGE